MRRIKSMTLVLIFVLSSCLVHNASAQNVLPEIEIDCQGPNQGGDSHIQVYPGATNSGFFYCILSNPTAWSEEVEITIESGILLAAGPGTVTVGPGADVEFQVSLRAESEMMTKTILVETKAVVVSWNGLPADSLPEASDTSEILAHILQYSAPTIQLTEAEISMVSGGDYDVGVIYGNNGNGNSDTMLIGVSEESRSRLEDNGFKISAIANSIEIDSGDSTTIQFEIRTPEGVTKEKYYIIEFYIISDFSCRYEYGCNKQTAASTILVTEAEPEGAFASLGENSTIIFSGIGVGIVVVAVAVVVLRKTKGKLSITRMEYEEFEDEFEYDEEYEEEFEDDLDDDFFDDL